MRACNDGSEIKLSPSLSLSLSLSVSDVDTMTSQAAAAGCCLTVEDANETTNEPTGILTT